MPAKGSRGGRRGGKGGGENATRRSTRSRGPVGLDPDLEEDVDKFMDGRNKIMLDDENAGAHSDEDEDDVDVVGLGGDSDDSDDDSDDDAGARKAALSDDDDEEDRKGAGEDESGWWGKRKGDYYDADEAEDSEDEREEEKEALKLQQKRSAGLRAEDFGDDDIVSSDDDSTVGESPLGEALDDSKDKRVPTKGKSAQKASEKKDKNSKKAKSNVRGTTEGRMLQELDEALGALDGDGALRVESDLSGMSEREKMKLLKHDAPELTSLMSDFKTYMKMLRTELLPAREAAIQRDSPLEGRNYLDTKIQLATRYCSSVAFYFLLRAEGMSVKTHPVIDTLVDLRKLLAKLEPLDRKLKGQIRELLAPDSMQPARSQKGGGGRSCRAQEIDDDEDEDEEEEEDEEDEEEGDDFEEEGLEAGSDGAGEEEGGEEEGSEEEDDDDSDGDFFFPQLGEEEESDTPSRGKRLAAKGRGEEPAKASRHAAASGRSDRLEFDDDIIGEEVDGEEESGERAGNKRRGAVQGYRDAGDIGDGDEANEDADAIRVFKKRALHELIDSRDQARRNKKASKETGEKDVPARDRRAVIQQVENRKLKERQRLQLEEEQASKDAAEAGSGPEIPEDPYYAAVKAAQVQAKQVKAAKYAFPEREYAPVDKVGEGEKRGAGYQITKNRGLVPHRNKDKKNPRVKHRLKYEKAKTKERTSFYGKQARLDNSGAYGGEATGIKSNIARSRKLDSKDH